MWVILPSALVAPMFFSSSAFSSGVARSVKRCSKETEKGINISPGLLVSIQALILANLSTQIQTLRDDTVEWTDHLFFFRI